jgi:hypothetical protein
MTTTIPQEVKPSEQQKRVYYSAIEKFEKHQKLKAELLPYLEANHPHLFANQIRHNRIKECCNVVSFRRYLETGDVKLTSSTFCKYDRICIACATKRAMRMIKKFSLGVDQYKLWNKNRYYIVLTIQHNQNDTLEELLAKLMKYKEQLARNYRNWKRNTQRNKSFFSQFDGMVTSVEIAHRWKNWWHPHINILACTDNEIQIDNRFVRWATNDQLLNERKQITWWSYIHNIRKINVTTKHFSRSGVGEVFKYAIKFSDLTVEQLSEVMIAQDLHQYRFFATYGIFRGWKLDEKEKQWGDWKDGLFLYDSENTNYKKI